VTDRVRTDWASVVPGSNGESWLLTACGKVRSSEKFIMGNVNPFELIHIFLGQLRSEQPPTRQ
jgi:hypothetical protein